MDNSLITPFSTIYDSFLDRVEDSMYIEFTELDTIEQLQGLLINAIPRFRFPRFDIYDYEEGCFDSSGTYIGVESEYEEVPSTKWVGGSFNSILTKEEINILSLSMVVEWLGQQMNTTENTRMKSTGSDFKLSSQANQLAKLKVLMDKYEAEVRTAHDTYRRRVKTNKGYQSTMSQIMEVPKYGLNIR